MKGVDISHYQDGLTIRQLMDAGKDFAVIKVTEGTGCVDPSAFTFYREAHELGFPLGGYCYSHAVNAQQAMAEAAFLMETIKGFPLPCGVYLDIEEPEQLALPHDTLLDIIRDPGGNGSYAWVESGTTYSYSYTESYDWEAGLTLKPKYGLSVSNDVGLYFLADTIYSSIVFR